MMSWVDVLPGDWFYNDVIEASNMLLEDGEPFISGIPYGGFEAGAPYVYEEFTAGAGQVDYIINQVIQPTGDNPLYVYIDGTQTVYKQVTPGATTTTVTLYVAPKVGATVSFASYGKPSADRFGKPNWGGITPQYPSFSLSKGASYVYDPFNRKFQEYCYAFGRALKRVQVDDAEWVSLTPQEVASKYIRYYKDRYCISPSGQVLLPYNLNNVGCTMVYLHDELGWISAETEVFKPTAPAVLHNNRFFPNAYITRAEAFVLIARLRETFYSRFTDMDAPSNVINQTTYAYQGQQVYKINGTYPAGESQLEVRVNGSLQDDVIDYVEQDNHTVIFNSPHEEGTEVKFFFERTASNRLYDVGRDTNYYDYSDGTTHPINGTVTNSWWAPIVLAMEDETFNNGDYLLNGFAITNRNGSDTAVVDHMYNPLGGSDSPQAWFMPSTLLTRAEAVTLLNRFRKWSVERFK